MTILDQIRGLASQGISRAGVEATVGRSLTKDELQAYRKAATMRRLKRAKEAQEAARRKREEMERRGRETLDSLFEGTAWPDEMKKPLSSTERSHNFRARGRELGEIPIIANPLRRLAAKWSLLKFGITYCMGPDKMIKRPPSPRMVKFVDALQQTIEHGGNRHVRWPRGKGKSTWLKVAAIWALVFGFHDFVVIIAATKPMAEIAVDEIWKFCTEDPIFAEDFPEFAKPLADVSLTPQRCRVQTYKGVKTHICENARYAYKRFATLQGFPQTGGIIAARGTDQAIRGLNIDSKRPSFIFLDDPQTDEDAKSTGRNGRVDKIEARIQGALQGLGETNKTISAVMASTPIEPNDISERYADPERHGEWLTTTETLVVSFGPKEWITAYLREVARDNAVHDVLLTRSRAFYIAHRAEIEQGVEMMDNQDYDDTLEVSAYQHALNRLHVMKAKAFYAECQMKPTTAQGVFKLSADKVAEHVNGFPLGIIPPQCDQGVLAFCDINDDEGLRWELGAFGAGRIVAVLAYGRYPKDGSLIPDGTPLSAKPKFLAPAMREVARAIKSVRLQSANGIETVRGICFDGGWLTDTVAQICAELDGKDGVAVCWSKGFASQQYSRYHHERAKVTKGLRAAEECHTWATANGQYLAFNTDYWKETSQSSFLAPPLAESSSSFYGTDKVEHFEFAAEVAAEELESKVEDRRCGSIWKWKVNGMNHYGDCHAGLMVFGAIRGNFDPVARLTASDVMTAAKLKRKVRYVVE